MEYTLRQIMLFRLHRIGQLALFADGTWRLSKHASAVQHDSKESAVISALLQSGFSADRQALSEVVFVDHKTTTTKQGS